MAHPAHSAHLTHSANEPIAGRHGSPATDVDYDAILATLTATERGRAFLAEHGRRSRGADTTTVLAAIDHIGAALRGETAPADAPNYLQLGLIAMAELVAAVEADMSALSTGHETPDSARPRVQRLVGTLRDLGDCIHVMLDSWQTKPLPQPVAAPAAITAASALMPIEASPAAQHSASPVAEFAADLAAFDELLPSALTDAAVQDQSRADALAALRSLSDAELIALFT